MTDTVPPPGARPIAPDRLEPIQGIDAIRGALGLGEREEALVHEAGRNLSPYVDGWVDAFYTRLLTEPNAMKILHDDARVIRLKRSLTAWFHELFSLPFDENYVRTRDAIGDTHVRIQLPPYLMVTAMSGVKRDVRASVREVYAGDHVLEADVARALHLAFDMELALMLSAFRRRERALARRHDRAVYAERSARRFSHLLFDRADAALCYAELAARDGERRAEHVRKLKDLLGGLSRLDHRMRARTGIYDSPPRGVRLGDLCARALENVAQGIDSRIDVYVDPPDLAATLVAGAVELAVEELVQNGVEHAAGVQIRVTAQRRPEGTIVFEVTDEGPGWDPDVHEIGDIYAIGTGLGLSFCELVAELHGGSIELFRSESGGAGVRLNMREMPEHGESKA